MNRLLIGPVALPVSIQMARDSLRIDGDYLDAQITIWVKGVTSALEHEIGVCVMRQTWDVVLDKFTSEIRLPHPVISISSVIYRNAAGQLITLDPAEYKLDVGQYRSILRGNWPATNGDFDAVRISVVAGYGDTAESTPENIRLYILAKLSQQFDPITRLERETVQSNFIDRLLDRCRCY